MYDAVKTKIQDAGEVMVLMDSGEEHELHKHNVTFHDDTQVIEVDEAERIHWLNADKIERYWIHKDF